MRAPRPRASPRRRRPLVVAEGVEVGAVALAHHLGRALVVGVRRQRRAALVLARGGCARSGGRRRRAPPAARSSRPSARRARRGRAGAGRRARAAPPSGRPRRPPRRRRARSAGSPRRASSGRAGSRGNHGRVAERARRSAARAAAAWTASPTTAARHGSRTSVKRSQPSSREDPLRRRRRVVRQPVPVAPDVHVVDGQRRRRLGQRRLLEPVLRDARPARERARARSCSPPSARAGRARAARGARRSDGARGTRTRRPSRQRASGGRYPRQARILRFSRDRHDCARAAPQTVAPMLETRRRTRAERSLVLVAGSGRSGTSLFTGILQRLGYAVAAARGAGRRHEPARVRRVPVGGGLPHPPAAGGPRAPLRRAPGRLGAHRPHRPGSGGRGRAARLARRRDRPVRRT